MFAALIPWLATKGIGTIAAQIGAWQKRKADAEAAQNTLAVKEAELELARLEAVGANQQVDGPWVKRWRAFVRSLIGFAVIILIWKVLVNDMAFQQCGADKWIACTPEPGTFVMTIVFAVLGWYLMFGKR